MFVVVALGNEAVRTGTMIFANEREDDANKMQDDARDGDGDLSGERTRGFLFSGQMVFFFWDAWF